jgi:FMN phosphatase YigB (HAD superfamily)
MLVNQEQGRGLSLKPRVIFFDLGQTLITGAGQSPRRMVASRFDLSERQTRRVGRLIMTHPAVEPTSLARALKEILVDHDLRDLQKGLAEIWAGQSRSVKEIDGATAVLRSLKSSGIELGLISNTWHPLFEGFCENCREIAEMVDYSVLSYRLGIKKPSPDLFQQAITQTGAAPGSCWMVGDSYELDMEPALTVGMHVVWVLSAPEREKTLLAQVLRGDKARPDLSITHLEEILVFFSSKGLL